MRDPLAIDATLVIFGGTMAVLAGTIVLTGERSPAGEAIVAGATLTIGTAVVAHQFAPKFHSVERWLSETDRGQTTLVLLAVTAVVARLFLLPLLPGIAVDGMAGAAAAIAGVGLLRALTHP